LPVGGGSQLGHRRLPIDSAETFRIGDLEVLILGRDARIRNERARGRTKDLADIEALNDGETGRPSPTDLARSSPGNSSPGLFRSSARG
jgi:hypothetical protein